MDRRKRFWIGVAVLLLTPFIVLAAFVAYVYIANSQPQIGPLQTSVSPQVVFPWGESAYYVHFSGNTTNAKPAPPPPVDLAFMIDESGSMHNSLSEMTKAAHTITEELSQEQPGRIRFAMIRFSVNAEITTNWTNDPSILHKGLTDVSSNPKGTENDSRAAFNKLDELLNQARPEAKKIVIFYTDGHLEACSCTPMSESEMIAAANKLRTERQVEIYSIGLPTGSNPLMIDITGNSSHVKDPAKAEELAAIFREIKGIVSHGFSEGGGQLFHRLDGRHFSAPLGGTSWTIDSNGSLSLPINPVPETPSTYAHPLVPLSAGLWRVGIEPPKLSFVSKAGKFQTIEAPRRPLLLKITWLLLFLMLLPVLLWCLAHIQIHRPKTVGDQGVILPDIPVPSLPTRLPVLPRPITDQAPPIPTLFVGIGGAGGRALQAIRADLKQKHLGKKGEPYKFVLIDTDPTEPDRKTPFEDWEGYPIEPLIAPSKIRQVELYLPEHVHSDSHLAWFNEKYYQEIPQERLNLSDGAKGDRALARLSLFQWLGMQDSTGLLQHLVNQVKQLMSFQTTDGVRQIIIFASSEGGVGSGWFLDVGRILQRITRQQPLEGQNLLPQVIGILCDNQEYHHPENHFALTMELESSMMNKRIPHHVVYSPNQGLLDQIDKFEPYHWVFHTSASDRISLAGQCSDFAVTLVENQPRSMLLNQTRSLKFNELASILVYSAHVFPTVVYDQVRFEVFLQLLGPDVLLDLVPNAQGELRAKPISEDMALQYLENWRQSEPGDTPWRLLLDASISPGSVPGFRNIMEPATSSLNEWFNQAFSSSLTKQLQGYGDPTGFGWQRFLMPGEAVATLKFLAKRLSQTVTPELRVQGSSLATLEIVDQVIALATTAADELENWISDLCRICEQVATHRSKIDQNRRVLQALENRVYLDQNITPEQIEQWARTGLESWLGSSDTISAIRQRLFFSVEIIETVPRVVVHSYIAESQQFTKAEQLVAFIDQLAQTLAKTVPSIRIGGALLNQNEKKRKEKAEKLIKFPNSARKVLVASPRANTVDPSEQQVIESFIGSIPKTFGQEQQIELPGEDNSAIRRTEILDPPFHQPLRAGVQPSFIEMAECFAEMVRLRAEKKYQVAVPYFPPRVRMALAYPELFNIFSQAYKAGRINKQPDEAGRDQWTFLDTGEKLTFGDDQSLASASAYFVGYLKNFPTTYPTNNSMAGFEKLANWQQRKVKIDDEILTLIAIDVVDL